VYGYRWTIGAQIMKRFVLTILLFALAIVLLVGTATLAQAAGYELPRWLLGSGGGHLTAGNYDPDPMIGQPVAGSISAGNYALSSGFWWEAGTVPVGPFKINLPLVVK